MKDTNLKTKRLILKKLKAKKKLLLSRLKLVEKDLKKYCIHKYEQRGYYSRDAYHMQGPYMYTHLECILCGREDWT